MLGIYRSDATQSTVTATLAGAAGTVIQAGTRAATRSGALFRLRADATIGSGFHRERAYGGGGHWPRDGRRWRA